MVISFRINVLEAPGLPLKKRKKKDQYSDRIVEQTC